MMPKNILPFPARPASETNDLALLAACARRDTQAMGLLFDRHARTVYRFLARLHPECQADLDDWVHATFIKAIESARGFRQESEVRTWLLGIALNIGRQHVRKERRRSALLNLVFGHSAATAPQPDHLFERAQDRSRLAQALENLGEEQRAAFVLCDLEGLTGKSAAAVLDIPQGTLGRRLFEARRSLREALREEEP
jgi:RNA polymerase sigma factor (sigma-70 family)